MIGDTLRSLGDRAELLARSVAGSEPREGRYTFVARNSDVLLIENARPWGSAEARALSPGQSWVVVTEEGDTKDSALVTVSPSLETAAFGSDIFAFVGRTVIPHIVGTLANGNAVQGARISFRALDENHRAYDRRERPRAAPRTA